MHPKQLQKETSLAFDDRTMKIFRNHADRFNQFVSALLRLNAAKLEAGEIKL